MKVVYIFDDAGNFPSDNSGKNYSKMSGYRAIMAMNACKADGRCFIKISDEEWREETWMEVEKDSKKAGEQDRKRRWYLNRIEETLEIQTVSLDQEVEGINGEKVTLRDCIPDERVNVEKFVEQKLLMEEASEYMQSLPRLQKKVLYAMFEKEKTMTERKVSEKMDISKTKVHKIKANALKRIGISMKVSDQSTDF